MLYLHLAKSRRRAIQERAEAARDLEHTRSLSSYVDTLTWRCAEELESNNFGDAIRLAMRRRTP